MVSGLFCHPRGCSILNIANFKGFVLRDLNLNGGPGIAGQATPPTLPCHSRHYLLYFGLSHNPLMAPNTCKEACRFPFAMTSLHPCWPQYVFIYSTRLTLEGPTEHTFSSICSYFSLGKRSLQHVYLLKHLFMICSTCDFGRVRATKSWLPTLTHRIYDQNVCHERATLLRSIQCPFDAPIPNHVTAVRSVRPRD